MDISFLPSKYIPFLQKVMGEGKNIWEIRIRENCPILIRTDFGDEFLKNYDNCTDLVVEKGEIENILLSVSGQGLYKISDAMCNGVVFTDSGVRIGVCGKGIFSQGTIRSLTEITSLSIRFPYRLTHHAKKLLPYLKKADGALCSTLILSAPAGGKTTLLRDFANCFALSGKNVTVVDERLELSYALPKNTDIIREIPKDKAVLIALRSLNPDVIICDELFSEIEVGALSRACYGGVCLFASLHATSVKSALSSFPTLNNCFQRYICLQTKVDRLFSVYDSNENCLAEGLLC